MRGRALGVLVIAIAAAIGPSARADDTSMAKRDVVVAEDFRVRVTAALALGRSRDVTVRPLLERALSDANAAVRTAAAAALGVLGDVGAVAALQRQLAAVREAGPVLLF